MYKCKEYIFKLKRKKRFLTPTWGIPYSKITFHLIDKIEYLHADRLKEA